MSKKKGFGNGSKPKRPKKKLARIFKVDAKKGKK